MRNFTQEEAKVIYNDAKNKGLDPNKVMSQLVQKGATFDGIDMNKAREYSKNTLTPQSKPIVDDSTYGSRLTESYSRAGERITSGIKTAQSEFNKGVENVDPNTGMITPAGVFQAGKAAVRGVGRVLGTVAGATAEPIMQTEPVQNVIKGVTEKAMSVEPIKNLAQRVSELSNKYPEISKDLEDIINIASVGTGKALEKPVANVVKNTAQDLSSGAVATAKSINTGISNSGVGQIGSELIERAPRALSRVKEEVVSAGERAARIKNAPVEVANAIKSNLDDRIINTISSANDETKKAFKNVIDIAEETPKTIGLKKQPSIVGGELASKQYDIINKQKQSVGAQLGELTKKLSKTEKVNMQDSFTRIDDILSSENIKPIYTKKGVQLDFSGSRYTPAERTKIQDLYNLATEGGDNLSPAQIKSKDQLFSKLKRESNFEGVGDIIIETPDGNKSLFNVFRDIYSNKLDTISPEIKKLNSNYRKLSQVTDDIEDSIFKTPNFNATKSVDPAEFAKVNMRRIFGESQSSPAFEAVANVMDKASRGLGYKGATPKEVAEFAEYVRKLYPESVPKTGFQGGIKAGLSDVIETVSKLGAPNLADQKKAMRELIEKSTKQIKK